MQDLSELPMALRSAYLAMHRQTDAVFRQHGVTAVSYTHLRAHETVLDIVCRLLLEKKNNKTKKKNKQPKLLIRYKYQHQSN